MRRHISDTSTMRWEIYYVHPQSGRTLFLDTLCQASAGCRRFAAAKICGQTYIDTSGQLLRITAVQQRRSIEDIACGTVTVSNIRQSVERIPPQGQQLPKSSTIAGGVACYTKHLPLDDLKCDFSRKLSDMQYIVTEIQNGYQSAALRRSTPKFNRSFS